MNGRLLLAGIGGIGGVIAARLAATGERPVLLSGNPSITEAIRQNGLQVVARRQRRCYQAECYTTPEQIPADMTFSRVLLLMKANNVVDAARAIISRLDDDGYLVTCQNGIVEDAVAATVGAKRLLAAIVGWGGTMHAPGVYEQTGPGAIYLGELDGARSERVERLAALLKVVSPVVVSRNIRGALWAKLAINCVITTLGAVTGQTLGKMLQEQRLRRVFLEVYREVLDTAAATGIKLERIVASPRLLYLPAGAGFFQSHYKDLLVRLLGRRYRRLRSSMLQSLERGRPTEIDYLNSYVVEQAGQQGMPVPYNQGLVRIVKAIEAGERNAEPGNLNALLKFVSNPAPS